MKAILLVAGRGSRLGALTTNKPKSLVEFNGKPLLQRAVEALRAGGVSEIGAVGGYRSEQVAPWADRLFLNPLWNDTGIFRSLLCAREWLAKETCIISYGDIFYSDTLVRELIHSRGEINLTWDPEAVNLWRQRCENPLDDMESFAIAGDRIVSIGEKATNLSDIQGQYMGLFKITPTAWRWIEDYLQSQPEEAIGRIDMTGLFSRLIANGYPVYGTKNSWPWGEIDTPSDLALYSRIYPHL